jgi:cytochrome bd-type quinol oxidase subunit 1
MDEIPQPAPSGWTFSKVVGAIVGLIGMVGFGVCSLCGLFIGANGGYGDVWVFVIPGALLTWFFGWLTVTMFRKARESREDGEQRDRHDRRDL